MQMKPPPVTLRVALLLRLRSRAGLGGLVALDLFGCRLLAFTRFNRDLARLYLLGDFFPEVDDKQAVLKFRADDAHMIGKFETAGERSSERGRDAGIAPPRRPAWCR